MQSKIEAFHYLEDGGYFTTVTPVGYSCGPCGKTQVRLYRLPGGASCHKTGFDLWCFRCAFFRKETTWGGWEEHHLNDVLPAIPTEDGTTYWTSPPDDAVLWWKRFPAITPDMMQEVRP